MLLRSSPFAANAFTGHQTGLSKGVSTTHANLVYVITCCGPTLWPTFDLNDTVLHVLPLFHIFGLIK
jgi:acyl-CoA synthetase (AMP-forming)/AMP-acid ligase II